MNILLPTLHVRPSAQAVPLAAACLVAALPDPLRPTARLLNLFPDQSAEQMEQQILAAAPDLVAFPLYLWNRGRLLALARSLRQHHPQLVLVAGGPEASADPTGVLHEGGLDAVICGEGEGPFAALVSRLAAGEALSAAPGLLVNGDGQSSAGPPAPLAELTTLPSPWLTGVLTPEEHGGVLWETTRGCPFACDFCFDARGSRAVRHFDPRRLTAELELFHQAGVAQVWVLDSTFNFPPQRGKDLLRLLARKAPETHFHLEAKADFLDRETARLLARLICSVQIGVQSIHSHVLKNLNRPEHPADFAARIQLLNREGITFGFDLIYGLPGDDHRGFKASLDALLPLAPNQIDLFPLAVLPGTALYRQAERFGLEARHHPPYTVLSSHSYSRADLEQSRLLAAAADLFYNTGRAVGFFAPLLKATGDTPSAFLESFAVWCRQQAKIDPEDLCDMDLWQAKDVLPLQEGFVRARLHHKGKGHLGEAALDLLRYHFHYAESLLGNDTLAATSDTLQGIDLWNLPLHRAPEVRLVPFAYEILDLLEMGEVDLEQFCALFRPVGSVALFLRRGGEVICESLEEDFITLLQGSNGRKTPQEIFAGSLSRREGAEIVEFAVGEGLLRVTAAADP